MNGEDFISGKLILIDKEKKWSSFDVVNKIRNAIKKKFSITECIQRLNNSCTY